LSFIINIIIIIIIINIAIVNAVELECRTRIKCHCHQDCNNFPLISSWVFNAPQHRIGGKKKHTKHQDRREVVSTGQHLWPNLRHSRTELPLLMHFRHYT